MSTANDPYMYIKIAPENKEWIELVEKWYFRLRTLMFPVIFQKNCRQRMKWICQENAINIIAYVVSLSFL